MDLFQLTKPRVTVLILATTSCGILLAPTRPSPSLIFFALLGTALIVGAANSLNMYFEKDIDALMKRTKNRPLPAKRLSSGVAFWFGIGLAVISILILSLRVNLLTALLGLGAFSIYVLLYTPLKQKSHVALLVGAVPGAIPPLMGWTAATGKIALPGLILFCILFLWQIPHFLAIALMHKGEFEKAGVKVLPLEKGDRATKQCLVRYLMGLVAFSLYPVWLHLAGKTYFWMAMILGGGFFLCGVYGLRPRAGILWAKGFFLASLIYLPLLLLGLCLA